MELIVIDGMLYRCKDGTNTILSKLSKEISYKPASMHENESAGNEFNEALDKIKNSKKGQFIDNVYMSY